MKSSNPPSKRITLALRDDLSQRALEKAALLQQNPNNFVNLCVEGILDAMDAPGNFDIPILDLYSRVKGRTFLTSKAIISLMSVFVPEIQEIDDHERQFLMDLVNKHNGKLTPDLVKAYGKIAQRMNLERIAHEKEFKKLQSKVAKTTPERDISLTRSNATAPR